MQDDKKRKFEEIKTDEKTANKKKKKTQINKYYRWLENITTFHKENEVHDITNNIIDGRIESIAKELGISPTLMKIFPVPRTELLEEVKRIVLKGVQIPLKILISRMPHQVKRLIDLTSTVDEKESIMPEVYRLIENEKQETDSKHPASFRKMIIQLEHIRFDIVKMIADALKSENLWKNKQINPINSLRKPAMTTIIKEVFLSVVPFSAGFSRFLIDDEEGFYSVLDQLLD